MVFVERPLLRVHVLVPRPRFGNQHRHGVGDSPPRHHQQLQRVVERRRIAAARLHDGEQLLYALAEVGRFQHGLPRLHPVHVPAQRVDLPVVRHVAERVRQLPGGESVRREPLVHQAQRAHHLGIAQLRVEVGDLRRQQQSFIYDGAPRKRRHVEELLLRQVRRADLDLRPLAHHVQLALQLDVVHALGAAHEDLLDVGLRHARHAPDGAAVDGRIPPPQHRQPFLAHDPLHDALALQPRMRFHRQEHHAHAVLARGRQREPQFGAFAREETVRDLNQHARAVAGFRVATARAAMRQVDQNLDSLDDDVVRLVASHTGHEADAASVVLVARIVKTLGWG